MILDLDANNVKFDLRANFVATPRLIAFALTAYGVFQTHTMQLQFYSSNENIGSEQIYWTA
jgi:hypothetical protein